jgi:hypothetical protein
MSGTARPEGFSCSFCGKSQFDVVKLVAGPGVSICNECIDLCHQIIAEEAARTARTGRPAHAAVRPPGPDAPPTLKAWDGLSDDALLAEMVRAHAAHVNVDRAVGFHVAALRARGVSWARIGEALGMTRQSAWERWSGDE